MILKELIQKLLSKEEHEENSLTRLDILSIVSADPIGKEGIDEWVNFCQAVQCSQSIKVLCLSDNLHTSNINKLTVEQWATFFTAIAANKSIVTVEFSRLRFGHVNIQIFFGLMVALAQNATLQHLEFQQGETFVMQMSGDHWLSLLHLAKKKDISIKLDDSFTFAWNDDNLQGLRLLAAQGRLISLDLWGCHLSQMQDQHFELLCKLLVEAKYLRALNLEMNGLGNITIGKMQMLCDSLSKCQSLQKLLIGRNLLTNHDCKNLMVFCSYLIKTRNLRTLYYYDDLENATLSQHLDAQELLPTMACYKLLFTAIAENKDFREMNVQYSTPMCQFPSGLIEYIQSSIQKSSLSSVSFSGCNISLFNDACWREFCKGIRNSHFLLHLDLSMNNLGEISYGRFKALCSALKSSTLRYLNLSSNHLNGLSLAKLKLLLKALQSCGNLGGVLIAEGELNFQQNYHTTLQSAPLHATKGMFLAAADSLMNAHKAEPRPHKKQALEQRVLSSRASLNTDCVDLILSFLPARLPRKSKEIIFSLEKARNAAPNTLDDPGMEEIFTKKATDKQHRDLRKSALKCVGKR